MTSGSLAFIVSGVSVTLAVLALLYTRSQARSADRSFRTLRDEYVDDHEYRRRQAAAQLIRDWDEHIFLSRSVILALWPDRFNAADPIPWSEIIAEREKTVLQARGIPGPGGAPGGGNPSATLTVTDHMAKILNYFELVAHCVTSRIADEGIIREFLRNPFYKWYGLLESYRDVMTRHRKYDPWPPVTRLYRRWYPDVGPEAERPRTGVPSV